MTRQNNWNYWAVISKLKHDKTGWQRGRQADVEELRIGAELWKKGPACFLSYNFRITEMLRILFCAFSTRLAIFVIPKITTRIVFRNKWNTGEEGIIFFCRASTSLTEVYLIFLFLLYSESSCLSQTLAFLINHSRREKTCLDRSYPKASKQAKLRGTCSKFSKSEETIHFKERKKER